MGKALALRSERLTSVERAMITEGKRKKYTVKVPWLHLCQLNMDICLPRQTERWTRFSFLTLLQKPGSWFQRLLLSWPPAATPSWPQIQPRSFISWVLLTVSPTAKPNVFCLFSKSFPKSYQINWQKQLQALSQLPNTPGSFSLPSTTQNALGKTFPVALVSLQPQINRFAPRVSTTALAHNCSLGYSYNVFYFILMYFLCPCTSYFLLSLCTTSRTQKKCCSHTAEYCCCERWYG